MKKLPLVVTFFGCRLMRGLCGMSMMAEITLIFEFI